MTGSQLLERLKKMSKKQLELPVWVYTESEDGSFARGAKVCPNTNKGMPYHKGYVFPDDFPDDKEFLVVGDI